MTKTIIIQGVGGSQAYGTATATSDTDRYAVYVAPMREFLGFTDHVKSEHVTEPEDFHYHELQKFLHLTLKGNPTIMELLWLDQHEILTETGELLVDNRQKLLGKVPIEGAYLGYATQQLKRHGHAATDETSESRERRLKHLGHCYRLLLQAESFIATGTLRVRLTEGEIEEIEEFRELNYENLAVRFERKRYEIENIPSRLPDYPDRDWAEDFLIHTRLIQCSGLSL